MKRIYELLASSCHADKANLIDDHGLLIIDDNKTEHDGSLVTNVESSIISKRVNYKP